MAARLLVGVTALGLAGLAAAQTPAGFGPWKRVKAKDGVVVYSREVPGTPIREVRGTGVIDAPLLAVLAVINDVDAYPQWMPKVRTARALARPSRYEVIGYSRMRAPWPVADRDAVVRARARFDRARGEVAVALKALPWPSLPPPKGVVRMPRFDGLFTLRREGAPRTRIDYQVLGDPAGNVPVWIANLVARELPLKTIQRLRKRVAAVGALYGAWMTEFAGELE
jgi:hypothetical protein